MRIHHKIKKHTLNAVNHVKRHKHYYIVSLLGSFAVVKMMLLFLGLFGILTIKNTLADYSDGLVGYWSLDTNANDYTSNNNNGTAFDTNAVIGKINNAYDFNGINSYINIPNSDTLNITGTITIQAWIKRDSQPTLGPRRASIVNKGGDNQYRLQHTSTNTGFEFAIRTMSGTSFVASTTVPQQDVWYFLVGTYDGSSLKIYVNGSLERSVSRSSPIMSTGYPLNIGRRSSINDRYFDGTIDEVAIWNRALSSTEILGLYNAGAGLSLSPITTYTLNYNAGSNGVITGNTSQIINEGTNGTAVTAVASTGYYFTQWSDGSLSNPRIDTNVTGNISVTAEFATNPISTYTLNYSAGEHGILSGDTSQIINEGEDGTAVTAVANAGYHFTQWSDGSPSNPRIDTHVTGNISVTAEFVTNPVSTYTLSYLSDANGTIDGTVSQTINEGGAGTAVTAVANAGYHFTQWSDGSPSNPRTDTNVTGNITVTAQFAINSSTTYNNGLILYLPFDSDMHDYSSHNNHGVGVGDISSIGGKIGGAYDFSNGEKYVSVADNESLRMIGSSYTLSSWIYMTNEQSEAGIISKGMYPSSGPGYGFMISNTNPGSISGNPPGERFYSSNSIQLNDWQLITVTFDASTNNHAIYVNGNLDTETVNGGKAPLDDSADLWIGNWREGDYDFEGYIDEVAIWNRALSSNEISGLYNNGNGISLLDDATTTYTLNYSAGDNGTLSGDNSQTVNEGEDGVEITAVADTGYYFTQRSDGSTTNPRTDTNVTGNITVTAQFAITSGTTYTLSYSAGEHGTLSGDTSQTINEGGAGTAVTAVANAGYHFTQWSDGVTSNPRTDTNVTGNITVTAEFAINSSTTYNNGLILYLPFDSDMHDYSSHNNHGIGVGEINPIGGKVGGAYDFGNGEKHVSVADNEALRMIGSSYTLSTWIYMNASESEAGIISKGMYSASGPGYGFMIAGENPAGISGHPPGNWVNSSYSVPLSDWRLITITYDSSTNNHAIYVNGNLDTETVNGGKAPLDDSGDLWIGNWREGDYDFEGYIDEVAIWNRNLSSNEISGLYNNGNGLSLLDDSPNTYTLHYSTSEHGILSGTTSQTINEGDDGTSVMAVANTGYYFVQWSDGLTTNPRIDINVTGNISVTAQFEIEEEEEQLNNSNSSPNIKRDICPNGDNSQSYYDNSCGDISQETHSAASTKVNEKIITRKVLARFLVFFATKFLDIELDTTRDCSFGDISKETSQDRKIMKESCQMGFMGLKKDGSTPDTIFRPNDKVSRNEFIVTISRLLYNEKNNTSLDMPGDGLQKHMNALSAVNLGTDIPDDITRGVVVDTIKFLQNHKKLIQRE